MEHSTRNVVARRRVLWAALISVVILAVLAWKTGTRLKEIQRFHQPGALV